MGISLYLEQEGWEEHRQGVLWVEDDKGEEKLFNIQIVRV